MWRVIVGILVVIIPHPAFATAEDANGGYPDGNSWSALIIVTEGFAFGTAALSRSESGARFIGAVEGVSGTLVLGRHILAEGDNPGFEIPYAIGLLGMSYYNLTHASAAASDDKFRNNVIGVNAIVLVASLIGSYQVNESSQNRIAMGVSPYGFNVNITF